jgi:glycolate oxidase FAD binding subunit
MTDALQRLVERVRAARAAKTTLAIRGGGTKDFYGGALKGEPLDTRELAGISRYEPSELVVTARAGTPLAELEAVLAERGQCLAFEPPRYGCPVVPFAGLFGVTATDDLAPVALRGGTVGGMVAAGLAGPARATVGGVRDFLLGATLLNGRAEVLSFGGQVMKNVAGYDVARLLAGSMGVLGVICEVSLKVLPEPPAHATLRFDLDELKSLRQLAIWGGQALPISASAWWRGALVVRLAGARAAVQAAIQRMGGEPIDNELADAFWRGLRDHTDEYFDAAERAIDKAPQRATPARAVAGTTPALWRLSVPPTALPIALAGDQLIEWCGAQRWWLTAEPAARVREAAAALGGHATLFRARDKAVLLPAGGVFAPLKSPLDRLHREMKKSFDPDGVFNPGRLYPDF